MKQDSPVGRRSSAEGLPTRRRPEGAQAVMAAHAPAVVEADSARVAEWRAREFFPTPPWAARAGGELIGRLDPGLWWCWEPACGAGHMAHGLAGYFETVWATDVADRGWDGQHGPPLDFLSPAADRIDQADWIVTNPPFGLAAEFVEAGLRRARRGVAILARMALLESVGRFELFYGDRPLSVLAPFTERVAMTLGEWRPKASTATAYAWFVWMQPEAAERAALLGGWDVGRAPVIVPVPPGSRARLTRSGDARLFATWADAPLFEGAGE